MEWFPAILYSSREDDWSSRFFENENFLPLLRIMIGMLLVFVARKVAIAACQWLKFWKRRYIQMQLFSIWCLVMDRYDDLQAWESQWCVHTGILVLDLRGWGFQNALATNAFPLRMKRCTVHIYVQYFHDSLFKCIDFPWARAPNESWFIFPLSEASFYIDQWNIIKIYLLSIA